MGDAGGRRGGRERRPAGPTPAELQSRQQQRQHLQQYLNRLWKGLIDAQKGDVFTVLDVLDKCSSLDERMQCVHALMRAPAEVSYESDAQPVKVPMWDAVGTHRSC